jgi:hypothetical protein
MAFFELSISKGPLQRVLALGAEHLQPVGLGLVAAEGQSLRPAMHLVAAQAALL